MMMLMMMKENKSDDDDADDAATDEDETQRHLSHRFPHNLVMFSHWKCSYSQEGLIRSVSLQHDWIVHADMDEHHVYPQVPLSVFLNKCDRSGVNVITGMWQDRVARFVILCPLE